MKKLIAIALTAAMTLSLAACGGNAAPASSAPADNAAPAAEAPAAEAPADNAEAPAADAAAADEDVIAPQDDWVKMNLVFATYLTETNPMQANIVSLQNHLDELMPGYITIETYANNTLLKGADIYDGILNGTCDIGVVQPDYTPARFPLTAIFSYPGVVYNGAEVATRVFHEWGRTSGADELKDIVFMMGVGSGPYCIFTKNKITSMADLKGKQIRAGAINASMIEDYGATPVTMDISEVYEAMRSGLIEGLYTNYGACAYQNLEDVGYYALVTPLNSNPSFFAMNKDRFNEMPESQQKMFMRACDLAFEDTTATYQDAGLMGDRVVEFASKTDCYFLEGDMLAEFQAANDHLMGELVADLDSKGLPGTETLEMAKALADKYNSIMTWEDYKACYPEDADPSNN
ncbi:MAG: TRAP transporter substrate-binding protein DctP [Lachnospiraceae bacterium]|nr:TRAP transporter substrate-binding protein DctP [Lachnospiraceae bacterium]